MPTAACNAQEAHTSLPSAHERRPHRLFRNVSQLVGSHALVGLVGLATLPLLARSFGPAGYGGFSLFVALLGVLSSLDFARPLLVRELSGQVDEQTRTELFGLTTTSALFFGPVAALLGYWVDGPWIGAGLGLGVFCFVLASTPYAALSAAGRVGHAGAVRNVFWTLALLAVTGLSFRVAAPHAYVWPFAAANLGILFTLRRLAPHTPLFAKPAPGALTKRLSVAGDVVGFGLAAAVVVSADRLLLEHYAPAETFGRYGAQYDLATKVNILSTALGAVLYPILSRAIHEGGREAAARDFVRLSTRIVVLYFAGLFTLLIAREPVQAAVLGRDFAGPNVYPIIVAGTFLHLFGFLIAPWQRARGNFQGQRRAYVVGAVVMLCAGCFLIPRYGAVGAAWSYLCARVAELLLIAQTVHELRHNALKPRHLVGLGFMVLTLFAYALKGAGA